jgi:hypothetical protein
MMESGGTRAKQGDVERGSEDDNGMFSKSAPVPRYYIISCVFIIWEFIHHSL